MHIAQVAPLTEAIPPKLYGGTERVVSWLTEGLIALGHEVTLYASGDSVTSARLEAVWARALRLESGYLGSERTDSDRRGIARWTRIMVRFALVPRRSGRSLMGMEAGGFTLESGSSRLFQHG